MKVGTAGALYFALVFAVAFVLGSIRTLLLEPAIGETWAVACEIPILITAMVFAARFVLRRVALERTVVALLAVGVIGLVLQQASEFMLVAASGETVAQHIAYLGTVAGRLYLAALGVFVLLPLALGRTQK